MPLEWWSLIGLEFSHRWQTMCMVPTKTASCWHNFGNDVLLPEAITTRYTIIRHLCYSQNQRSHTLPSDSEVAVRMKWPANISDLSDTKHLWGQLWCAKCLRGSKTDSSTGRPAASPGLGMFSQPTANAAEMLTRMKKKGSMLVWLHMVPQPTQYCDYSICSKLSVEWQVCLVAGRYWETIHPIQNAMKK